MTIKKKPGWSRYVPPYAPVKPTKPQKMFIVSKFLTLKKLNSYNEQFNLESLLAEPLPDGVKRSDLEIRLDHSHSCGWSDCSCECEISIELGYTVTEEHSNPHYEKLFKNYERDMVVYNAKNAEHKTDVEEWKAWEEQEKAREVESQLNHAEKLLRKHGLNHAEKLLRKHGRLK